MEEKDFQVWKLSFEWVEKDQTGMLVPNGTELIRMPLVDIEPEYMDNWVEQNWDDYKLQYAKRLPERLIVARNKLRVVDCGRWAWCLTQFSHFTYNTHLSDEKLIESFERHVARVRAHNEKHGHYDNFINPMDRDSYMCLMGAEEPWRWKGPCRCEHCQAKGVVIIDH